MATTVAPAQLSREVTEFLGQPRKMLIGGEWADAASGKTFETRNPANGEVLARVAEGGSADIDRAVKAARRAFEEGAWPEMLPAERSRLLLTELEGLPFEEREAAIAAMPHDDRTTVLEAEAEAEQEVLPEDEELGGEG